MRKIDIAMLSGCYTVRKLGVDDITIIDTFCRQNPQYYEYCGKEPSMAQIEQDILLTPPGIPLEQKYYVGFFKDGGLAAILDLVVGYPRDDIAFIGFFMMNHELQGRKIGSKIITDVLAYLRGRDFARADWGSTGTIHSQIIFGRKTDLR